MATLSNKLAITNLSQLIRSRQPLEILVQERNQEDNLDVLNFVNAFMDVVDAELKMPSTYKEYVFGQKELFVRNSMIARLELIASRILEKKTSAYATVDIDELNFFKEEIEFFVDLYFLLVTTMIDLTAIRKTDLDASNAYQDVFNIIGIHLNELGDFPELKELFIELDARRDSYPGHPNLEEEIVSLTKSFPLEEGDFIFYPARSVSDYSSGDVLISINPKSNVVGFEVGDLPSGVDLDQDNGNVYISDITALQPGDYDVVLKTSDEMGGQTTHHLELPIGVIDIPRYEVAPAKVIQAYLHGDILARPIDNPESIPVQKAEWTDLEKYPVPPGVTLNENTGVLTIQDEDFLVVGVYDIRIILTSEKGIQSKHEFSLSFKQDSKAVYTLSPSKSIKEFKQGDVLATVLDSDARIIGASKNSLPSGTAIDAVGNLAVSDPTKLVKGTYLFNVISTDSFSVESLKTLFITLKDAENPFSYDSSNLKPIDQLSAGEVIAELISNPTTAVEKVSLIRGNMPKGTILDSSGNITVESPDLLEVGNYDLRFNVYVNGINPSDLDAAKANLASTEQAILDKEASLETNKAQKLAAELSLNEYKSSFGFQKKQLELEIAQISEDILNASGDELQQLLILKEEKEQELNALENAGMIEIESRTNVINNFVTLINTLISTLTQLALEADNLNLTILKLRAARWIEYEANVLLTFEKDNPSAWHLEIPKDWDEYADNEVIAQLIDSDGYDFVQLAPADQTMPNGLLLNSSLGVVEVGNRNLLEPGEYVLTTQSQDLQNGTTNHRLAIIIGGDSSAQQENYVMLPSKPANNYSEGEILGYPNNPVYSIVSGRLAKGLLPIGVKIDPETGALFVDEPNLLVAGKQEGIVIKTVNSSGGVHYHNIAFSFVSKTEFFVQVSPPKELPSYFDGDVIVGVSVNQGILQGIQLLQGHIGEGMTLNSAQGNIIVTKASILVEGDYQVKLFMAETNGATDEKIIDFTIGTGGGDGGSKASVNWLFDFPVNKATVAKDTPVATPSIVGHTIVSATSDTIPSGLMLLDSNGMILVLDPAAMVVGTYTVKVDLKDSLGTVYTEQFLLEIVDIEPDKPVEVTAVVMPGRDFHLIKNGDELAYLQPRESISDVTLMGGSIPGGSILDNSTGSISVMDRYALERSLTSATLAVETLAPAGTKADAQFIDVVIENKPIPNFADKKSAGAFLVQIEDRLQEFKNLHLTDNNIASIVLPLYEQVTDMASWLKGVVLNADLDASLRAANYDAQMLKKYTGMGGNILTEFQKQTDLKVRSILADLYNEMYTTQMVISLYRDRDISNLSTNPVARIILAMRNDLKTLGDEVNVDFMVNNALIISKFIPKEMPNLQMRFSSLAL